MALSKEAKIIKSLQRSPHLSTGRGEPNALILPNHSGDHSRGTVLTTPANDNDIANKKYVDDQVAAASGLWQVDGTETQLITADAIDMQSEKIINLSDPTAAQDAATKAYVDASSTSPAGADKNIQYNASGAFGAESGFSWDYTNNRLGIGTDTPSETVTLKGDAPAISIRGDDDQLALTMADSTAGATDAGQIIGYTNGLEYWRTINKSTTNIDGLQIRANTNRGILMSTHSGNDMAYFAPEGSLVLGTVWVGTDKTVPTEASQLLVEGKIGAGTKTPSTPLEVVGTAKVDSLTIDAQATDVSMNSNKITSVTDPVSAQDAATKNYVDTQDAAIASDTLTFTNKTFDANATGNSLSNVDVADLANGTAGQLITWSAAGAPATVSTGTSGHVLTSNGAGAAPTFQAAAGGTKEFFIQQTSYGSITEVGDFATQQMGATSYCRFVFRVPSDFTSLTDCKVVLIPDATETIQWDVDSDYGASGETYNTHSEQQLNQTASATINQLLEVDVSGVLTSLAAGDYVGLNFQSDTTYLQVIGMRFKYA